jgi:hypothetical protein
MSFIVELYGNYSTAQYTIKQSHSKQKYIVIKIHSNKMLMGDDNDKNT